MSQISGLVGARFTAEGDRPRVAGDAGETYVPWQVCTCEGAELTIHYFTNAMHEFIRLECSEQGAEVRVAVLERAPLHHHRPSEPGGMIIRELPGSSRSATLMLSAPLGDRPVVDATTGRSREVFMPDGEAAWATFDRAAAGWLLGGERIVSVESAARAALADGCQGGALQRLAAGGTDLASVYRERGLPVPDERAAAKIAVDGVLAEAAGEDPYAGSVSSWLTAIAGSGRLDPDQRAQLRDLLALEAAYQEALETTGDGRAAGARLVAAARELHARGGLQP